MFLVGQSLEKEQLGSSSLAEDEGGGGDGEGGTGGGSQTQTSGGGEAGGGDGVEEEDWLGAGHGQHAGGDSECDQALTGEEN